MLEIVGEIMEEMLDAGGEGDILVGLREAAIVTCTRAKTIDNSLVGCSSRVVVKI